MSDNDKKFEEDLARVFGEVRSVGFQTDPHLSMKVMARLHEAKAGRGGVAPFWRWIGIGSSGLSAALVLLVVLTTMRAPKYEAFVGKPFVVKMEVVDLAQARIAKAEIKLPDGVYFDIEQYPELKSQRSLTLVWNNHDQKEFIPFVLQSAEKGKKTITVNFYDESNRLVGTKTLAVKLI